MAAAIGQLQKIADDHLARSPDGSELIALMEVERDRFTDMIAGIYEKGNVLKETYLDFDESARTWIAVCQEQLAAHDRKHCWFMFEDNEGEIDLSAALNDGKAN